MYNVHIYVLYVDLSGADEEQFEAVGRVYVLVIGMRGGGKRNLILLVLPLTRNMYCVCMFINTKYCV